MTFLTQTLLLLPFCYGYFDEGIVMLKSDEGEAFNCDREIGVPLQLKIRVLDRFQHKIQRSDRL